MGAATQPDVLVIGAGPSGLLAAIELARYGVQARVVERDPEPHRQTRATALQPGTIEILAQAGVADQILTHCARVEYARVFDSGLRLLSEAAFAGADCPWDYQASLPQWRTEQILADRLSELGGTVEHGVSAVSLQERDDGVLVGLEKADGSAEKVEAPLVIGAGGAHSVTRASMAAAMAGETYPGTALAAEIAVSCGLPRDGSALIVGAQGYVLLAPLPQERWITFVGDLSAGEAERLSTDLSRDAVAASIERRIPSGVRLTDVIWAAPFRMHRRMVERLDSKRRFLLGDAGHLSSPFGGEGLNSGLHDGHNLGWKLATELSGRARPGLLESYASEREAADQHVLAVADRVHELAHGAVESARTGIPAAPPSQEQQAALARSRAMLDVSYPGSPLTGEYLAPGSSEPAGPAPGDRYPDRAELRGTQHHLLVFGTVDEGGLRQLRRRWRDLVEIVRPGGDSRRAGVAGTGAVLVRPDGHIGFRSTAADPAGLAAVEQHLDTYLIPAA